MNQVLRHATGYSLASAAALALDVSVLVTLVELFRWHYLLAAAVAFMAGAVLAYALVTCFVFDYRRIDDKKVEFTIFAGIGFLGLAVNIAAIHSLVEYMAAPYLAAKGAAACLTFATNFMARRWLLFTPWPRSTAANSNN